MSSRDRLAYGYGVYGDGGGGGGSSAGNGAESRESTPPLRPARNDRRQRDGHSPDLAQASNGHLALSSYSLKPTMGGSVEGQRFRDRLTNKPGGGGGGGGGGGSSGSVAPLHAGARYGPADRFRQERMFGSFQSTASGASSGTLNHVTDEEDDRAFAAADRVLRQIRGEWSFMTGEDFNPISLVLSLMDESSLGKSYDLFKRMKRDLDRALHAVVSNHYHGFNSSIATFGGVTQNIVAAQSHITAMKLRLVETKEALQSKRLDLSQLSTRTRQHQEILKLLDVVEELRAAPEKLESLLSEKRFLSAVRLLKTSLRTMSRPEMKDIGALIDISAYLQSQESSLMEIMVEELHNHLYLKSIYCDNRWASYTTGQQKLPVLDVEEDLTDREGLGRRKSNKLPDRTSAKARRLTKYLEHLPSRAQDKLDDARVQNPETDSFFYIEMLLESLAELGKLEAGLETILNRIPIELNQIVDRTIAEIEERNEEIRKTTLLMKTPSSIANPRSSLSRLAKSNIAGEDAGEAEVLRDLLWTLYSKFDAILQSHRVLHAVVTQIHGRQSSQNDKKFRRLLPSNHSDIWRPMQSEIKALLHSYLTSESGSEAQSRGNMASVNDILRKRGDVANLHEGSIFKFSHPLAKDSAGGTALKKSGPDDEITQILRESVPGLISSNLEKMATQVSANKSTSVSLSSTAEGYSIGHHLVIRPDAFNVSILYGPTVTFLERVKEVLPGESWRQSNNFDAFLHQFISHVFLPQLEDKVTELFLQAVGPADAYQEFSQYKRYCARPILKGALSFMTLVQNLCKTLMSTPFHREDYGRLILSTLIQYYQKISERYRELVAHEYLQEAQHHKQEGFASLTKLSADWVQRSDLVANLARLAKLNDNDFVEKKNCAIEETQIEMSLKGQKAIARRDLILSPKRLYGLCTLYNSIRWLLANILKIRSHTNITGTANEDSDDDTKGSLEFQDGLAEQTEPFLSTDQEMLGNAPYFFDSDLELPLTTLLAKRLDALLATYQVLGETILGTLHIEMRLHTIHHLELALAEGNYLLEEEALEPEAAIVDLNNDLGSFDELATSTLSEPEHRFIFDGLAPLMNDLLTSRVRLIRSKVNDHGVGLMQRNILALQQNLKTITANSPADIDFERSKRFWDLVAQKPGITLQGIKEHGPEFSFDDYRTILDLYYGISSSTAANAPSAPGPVTSLAATLERHGSKRPVSLPSDRSKREYNQYLIEFTEVLDFGM